MRIRRYGLSGLTGSSPRQRAQHVSTPIADDPGSLGPRAVQDRSIGIERLGRLGRCTAAFVSSDLFTSMYRHVRGSGIL